LDFFNLRQFVAQTYRPAYRNRTDADGFGNVAAFISQFAYRIIKKNPARSCDGALFAGRPWIFRIDFSLVCHFLYERRQADDTQLQPIFFLQLFIGLL
jgi:hypothetical protein